MQSNSTRFTTGTLLNFLGFITSRERLGDNSSQATIRPKRQFVPFVKSDNSSQASIRPILKRRQFVPFVKSDNSSQIV